MRTVDFIGYKREDLGRSKSQQLRMEGSVPCVLYGGDEVVHFHTPMSLFKPLVYTPEAAFVNLDIEGKEYRCILQDIQFHPVSEIIVHADFMVLRDDRPVKMEIPVVAEGRSPGVAQGGKLRIKERKLRLKALPPNMPERISVDISQLELGKSIKVSDLPAANYEVLNGASNPVLTIEIPRALRGKKTEESEA